MENLIEPNIHPILVHFAYALSITAFISYLLAALSPAGKWRETLQHAANWMLAFGALAIVATIAAGFQAYYSVNHDAPSHAAMTTHRNWAVPSGSAILLLALWRWTTRAKPASAVFTALLAAAALSLSVTAWWGGKIVYGYGLGVKSMPVVTGDGHDHDHGNGADASGAAAAASADHDNSDGHHDGDAASEPAGTGSNAESSQDHADGGHDNSDGHHDSDDTKTAPPQTALDANTPEAAVEAYAAALRAGDEAAIRALLAPDVIIAEGGGAERSVDEYAGHHMPADMAFMAAAVFTLKKRDVLASGDMATVISESEVHNALKDDTDTIHSRMMETMVLKREDDRWQIIHIHWSSAPITGEHEH